MIPAGAVEGTAAGRVGVGFRSDAALTTSEANRGKRGDLEGSVELEEATRGIAGIGEGPEGLVTGVWIALDCAGGGSAAGEGEGVEGLEGFDGSIERDTVAERDGVTAVTVAAKGRARWVETLLTSLTASLESLESLESLWPFESALSTFRRAGGGGATGRLLKGRAGKSCGDTT